MKASAGSAATTGDAPSEPIRADVRRDRTRAALIAAGERLMVDAPLSDLGIEEIISAAGISRATFYNHFTDKDDLAHAVVLEMRKALRESILLANHGVSDPARRVARALVLASRFRLERPARAAFLGRSSAFTVSIYDQMNAGVTGEIGEGVAQGRFILPTVETGVLLFLSLAQACYQRSDGPDQLGSAEPFGVIARAQQLSAVLLRGLGVNLAEADQIAGQEADAILRPVFQRP